jgi:hypothetical protein
MRIVPTKCSVSPMTATAASLKEKFLDALRTELVRQDRSAWFAAIAAVVAFDDSSNVSGEAAEAGRLTAKGRLQLAYMDLDDPVVVALMESLLRLGPAVRDVEWSVSLKGNANVTDASAASIALVLSAVAGVATLDLQGTAMTLDGLRPIANAASRLAVKPEITLPTGEQLHATGSVSGITGTGTVTTTSTGPRGGRPTGVVGLAPRGASTQRSSSTGTSSVDLAALRKRRDELFRQEGVRTIDDARKEADAIEAKIQSSLSSSRANSPAPPKRPQGAEGAAAVTQPAVGKQQPKDPHATSKEAGRAAPAPTVSSPRPQQQQRVQQTPPEQLRATATGPQLAATGSGGGGLQATRSATGPLVQPRHYPTESSGDDSHASPPSSDRRIAVLQRQPHPAKRQKQQQQQHQQHHSSYLNPNMISSATIAVHHQRARSSSTSLSQPPAALAAMANAATSMTFGPHSPRSRGHQATPAGDSSAGVSPHAPESPGVADDEQSTGDVSGEGLSEDDETTPTEMPDRQDDIDILQNLAATDKVLNLCQAHPRLSHAAILDSAALRHITVLNIAQNGLTELRHLPPSLMRLDASGNELTSMSEAFMGCRLLLMLNLRRNYITAIDGLDNCLALKHLFMGRNGLKRVAGIGHIIGLESLDISFNNIKTESAIRALSQNAHLLHLILYGNPLAHHKRTGPRGVSGMRGMLRNLIPSLVAVDNERLPFPITGGGAARAHALAAAKTPPPKVGHHEDRSSFLGVNERVHNMSLADRSVNSSGQTVTGGKARFNQSSSLNRSGGVNVSAISNGNDVNRSLAMAAAVLNAPSELALAVVRPSAVTGYSAKERQDASVLAMVRRRDPTKRAASQPHSHHPKKASTAKLPRAHLQRLVDLHNATLIEQSMADRVTAEHEQQQQEQEQQRLQEEEERLASNRGAGPTSGSPNSFHASKSGHNPFPAIPHTDSSSISISGPHTDRNHQDPYAAANNGVRASRSIDPDAFGSTTRSGRTGSPLSGDVGARDAFMRNVQLLEGSSTLHSTRRSATNNNTGSGYLGGTGTLNSITSPQAEDPRERDYTGSINHTASRARIFSPGADGPPEASLSRGLSMRSTQPTRGPVDLSPARERSVASTPFQSRQASWHSNASPAFDDPDAVQNLRHVHFSPIRSLNRMTDLSMQQGGGGATMSDIFSPARDHLDHRNGSSGRLGITGQQPQQQHSGGVGRGHGPGTQLAEPSRRISTLLDEAHDPLYITEWIEHLDQDDRATHLALRTILVVLEHESAIAHPRANGGSQLTAEGQRCLDVVERNGLAEDMELPAEIADYFAFTDDELNNEEGVVSQWATDERRTALLQSLHRISENKTCLRYIVALVRSQRFELLSRFLANTMQRVG